MRFAVSLDHCAGMASRSQMRRSVTHVGDVTVIAAVEVPSSGIENKRVVMTADHDHFSRPEDWL